MDKAASFASHSIWANWGQSKTKCLSYPNALQVSHGLAQSAAAEMPGDGWPNSKPKRV